jgi:hypothetical protein
METFAPLSSSIAGTVAYVLVLREYYTWWIVAPVTLFALPIAVIVVALLVQVASRLVIRLPLLALGCLLLWTAATHDHRLGSAFTGAALLVVGLTAKKSC